MKDYYKILEIDKDASPEIIKVAYKLLVKKNHPDLKEGKEKKQAEEKIKEINEAYDILSNPAQKEEYDKTVISDSISVEQYKAILTENKNLKKELSFLKNNYNQSYNRTNYTKTQYTNMYDNDNTINYNNPYSQNNAANSDNNSSNNLHFFSNFNESIKTLIAIGITFLIMFLVFQIPFLNNLLLNIFSSGAIFIIIIVVAFYYYFYKNKQ